MNTPRLRLVLPDGTYWDPPAPPGAKPGKGLDDFHAEIAAGIDRLDAGDGGGTNAIQVALSGITLGFGLGVANEAIDELGLADYGWDYIPARK